MAPMRHKTRRRSGLRRILEERRRELQGEIESRLRRARDDHQGKGGDEIDVADAAMRLDLEQSLLQMRSETLVRIDEALVRLGDGDYGECVACGAEIAEQRLRVLPFAIRCLACEGTREEASGRAQSLTARPGTAGDFSDMFRS
jgi:DnaK suppressor protein